MRLSEATLQWEHWRARRRRRRNLKAWGGTVTFALAVLAVTAWGGLPNVFNVGEKGEAIAVKLGNPDGEDLPMRVSAVPDQVMQAVMSAQREAALNKVEETRASAPEATSPGAEPVNPGVKPLPQPVKATPASPVKPAVTATETKPAPTERVIVRGNEKGNSSELILKPQGEKISQNIYSPPYLYMPLPTRLEAGLLARVKAKKDLYSADERRAILLQFYAKGNELALIEDPGLPVRPLIWEILEDAGYDIANAEYKKGNTLRPVIITFRISVPARDGGNPQLLEVKKEQSSGSPAVDDAVLYAFKGSGFANGTGQIAQGRYTYDFAAKR